MGSHEGSYSLEGPRQPVRRQHPVNGIKRVHFAPDKVDDLSGEEKPLVECIPENMFSEEELNKNNNAVIPTEEMDVPAVSESVDTRRHGAISGPQNGTRSLRERETTAVATIETTDERGSQNGLKSDTTTDPPRNTERFGGSSMTSKRAQLQKKTKMSLDQLMMTLNFINITVADSSGGYSGFQADRIERFQPSPERKEVTTDPSTLVRSKPILRQTVKTPSRVGDTNRNRCSCDQKELETLYEDIDQSLQQFVNRTQHIGKRKLSGDYDNLFEEDTTDGGALSDAPLYRSSDLEIRERQSKLWMYKYNYLDFNKKVKPPGRFPRGYKSTFSLDIDTHPRAPTIYKHQGYISQSFDSYLDKRAVQNTKTNVVVHREYDGNAIVSPNTKDCSYSSDDGYFSDQPSSALIQDASRLPNLDVSEDSNVVVDDSRFSSPDQDGCQFITFKPRSDSHNLEKQNHHGQSSTHGSNQNHGYFTNNQPPSGNITTSLTDRLLDNQTDIHALPDVDSQCSVISELSSRKSSKETLSWRHSRKSSKKSKSREKQKKTGWKWNLNLCSGCGFKKIFLFACFQVNIVLFVVWKEKCA